MGKEKRMEKHGHGGKFISGVSCESVLFNINDLGEGEKDLQGMLKYEDEKVEG